MALAVDAIVGETRYDPKKVRWRGTHTRRFWLAGTYIEDMCALLDIDAIHREVLACDVLDNND
jgi:purine-binding chemotaxis protein CheW